MDGAAQDNQAFVEMFAFLNHFDDLPDPRQRSKVTSPLEEVLLLAVLAGAEAFVEIARFGGEKALGLLEQFESSAVPGAWSVDVR